MLESRTRLSIDVPFDIFTKLNDLLGEWRIKNQLFRKITLDLIKAMEMMTPDQRRFFIVSIIEGDLEITQYIKSVKKAQDAAERYKKISSSNDS